MLSVGVYSFIEVNNSKLKKLGWQPRVSTESGIIKTLKFFDSK